LEAISFRVPESTRVPEVPEFQKYQSSRVPEFQKCQEVPGSFRVKEVSSSK
jgi:hypothetical protein